VERTSALQVSAAEDMAAVGEVKMRDEAILWIDAVRKAFDCLVAALVHIGEGVAADATGIDEIERRDCLASRHFDGAGSHGGSRAGDFVRRG
jgi:hypothetical protein